MADGQTAVLLCLGCPAGTTFGIDAMGWQLGAKFCGVRGIPPGLHFVHHSAGQDTSSGEFVDVNGGDVLVRRWDDALETFAQGSGVSADDAERLVEAVRRGEYSHGLGHYPADSVHERWLGLSRHITPQLLARAGVPPGTRIVPGDSELLSRDSAKQAPQQQVAPYFADAPRTPHFAPMAARRLTGMTAGEVTEYNTWPEQRLARLLAEGYSNDVLQLLGEFELAFVLFLLISSLPALEHWKAAVHLVSACDETAVAWATLALGVVTTLTHQLALVPEDFFEDALTSDNFLLPSLSALARRAQSPSAPQPLRDAGRDLQLYVRSRFTLDLSLSSEPESPDDAPAVVQSVDAQESTRGGCVEPADDHGGASHLSGQTQRMGWMLPPDVLNGGGA